MITLKKFHLIVFSAVPLVSCLLQYHLFLAEINPKYTIINLQRVSIPTYPVIALINILCT